MAEPRPDLELINIYRPDDLWNHERNFAARYQAQMDAQDEATLRLGTPTETVTPQPEKPSVVFTGLKAAWNSFTSGGKAVAGVIVPPGETATPRDQPSQFLADVAGFTKQLAHGVMGMVGAPIAGFSAAAGQALENEYPDIANAAMPAGYGPVMIRSVAQHLGFNPVAAMSDQEILALGEPLTVREALEMGVSLAAPALIGKGKAIAGKAKAINKALGERGSIGEPPVPEHITGAFTPPPAPRPSPFAQGPKPKANLGRIGEPADITATIAEFDKGLQGIGAISAEVIPRAETAVAAGRKVTTLDTLLALDYQDLHVNATALRDARDSAFRTLRTMQLDSAVTEEQLAQAAVLAGILHAKAVAAGTDIGRALGSFNIISDGARAYNADAVAALARDVQAGLQPGDSIRARLERLNTKEQRHVFLGQLVNGLATGQNIFYEAWINGLLSNPVSHAANVTSNALTAAWGIVERQMAGIASQPFRIAGFLDELGQPESGVRMGEAFVMLRAGVRASGESFKVAAKTLREGQSPFGAEKMEIKPALTAETLGLSPTNPLGGIVDFTGAGVRLPSRLMMTEDAYFKWLNYRMDIEARAYRAAMDQGIALKERAGFMRDYIDNPPDKAQAASEQFAALQTFNKELTNESMAGRIGLVFQQLQRVPLMRLVIPFIRTPTNIGEYAWQRTPVLSLFSEQLYRDIEKGGATRDLAMARLGTSAMLAAVYMQYASSGVMTGNGPRDPKLKAAYRAAGWQPEAVRIGDELYSINRLDPQGLMLGAMANYAEIAGQIPEGHQLELAFALTLAISEAIKDKPYFLGLSTVIEAIEAPDKGSQKIIENYTRSLVPAGVRSLTRAGIPGIAEGDKTKRLTMGLTEFEQILNTIKAGLPGFSDTLPADMNYVTGEDIMYPPGLGPDLISPVLVTRLSNDPVLAEIVKNKVALTPPPKALGGQRSYTGLQMTPEAATEQAIPLTGHEYRQLLEIQTREIKDGNGNTLHQALTGLVTSGEYLAFEPGKDSERAWQIKKLYGAFHKAAIAEWRSRNPDFDEAIKARIEDRMRRRVQEGQDKPAQIAPGMNLPATLGR